MKAWIKSGFLEPADPAAQRIRAVKLTKEYQELADTIAKEPERYKQLFK
jgi:hypothetical protein